MPNVFDYLAWRGDLSFDQSPLNEADSLILCRLSYIPFDGLVPAEFQKSVSLKEAAARCLNCVQQSEAQLSDANPSASETQGVPQRRFRLAEDARLLGALKESRRFGGARLCGYVNLLDPVAEKQFAALTILLENDLPYLAFRGTDGTLVGWKEDFNMSFLSVVPAQQDAVAYLRAAAAALPGSLRAGGHSKGGNLAVYAAAFCGAEIQRRIASVYNHDGPGFQAEVVARAEFQHVLGRVHTFVPQSSVVGMLLQHEEGCTVIHSTNTWLLQHDLSSWETAYNGLVPMDGRTRSSHFIDSTLKAWLAQMSPEDRGKLVDGVYAALAASGAVTVADLNRPRTAVAVLRELKKLDEPTKIILQQAIGILSASARENLPVVLNRMRKEETPSDR